MAKGKKQEIDLIAEAQERAEHNINPYYWVNRVTRFRLAEWRASLAFSWIDLVAIVFWLIGIILSFKSLPKIDSFGSFLILAALGLYTVGIFILALLRFLRWLELRQEDKARVMFERDRLREEKRREEREEKKKHPKRRKDYAC